MRRYNSRMTQSAAAPNSRKSEYRKRLLELLLMERLGLDEESLDAENRADLPQALPDPDDVRLSLPERMNAQRQVDDLLMGGCKRGVVYWCLERLGPKAEARRKGEVHHVEVVEDGPGRSWTSPPKWPTRITMSAVGAKLRTALDAVHRYQDELLMASEALGGEVDLPKGGMLTDGPVTDVDAMLILQQSLSWAQKLAESWQGLNQRQWTKSLGPLYLLEYVWLCTKSRQTFDGPGKSVVRHRKTKLIRIDKPYADRIASLVATYRGGRFAAGDLVDKRQSFQEKCPNLHERMLTLLRILEASAESGHHGQGPAG